MRLTDRSRYAALLVLAAGFAGVMAAACGGAGDAKPAAQAATVPGGAASTDGPDACALIPVVELEQILGSKVAEPEPGQPFATSDARMTGCAWRTVDGSAGVSLALRRGAQYRPDAGAFHQYASGMEENMGTRPEVEGIAGLGSAALWDATNRVLMVRPLRPGSELNVQPYLGTTVPMPDRSTAREVAEAALRRLE